jgi:hypothetical protein
MYEYLTQRQNKGGLEISQKEMLSASIINIRINFYEHNILTIFNI